MRASLHRLNDLILVLRILTTAIHASDLTFVAEAGLWQVLEDFWRGISGAKGSTYELRYGSCMLGTPYSMDVRIHTFMLTCIHRVLNQCCMLGKARVDMRCVC